MFVSKGYKGGCHEGIIPSDDISANDMFLDEGLKERGGVNEI